MLIRLTNCYIDCYTAPTGFYLEIVRDGFRRDKIANGNKVVCGIEDAMHQLKALRAKYGNSEVGRVLNRLSIVPNKEPTRMWDSKTQEYVDGPLVDSQYYGVWVLEGLPVE